MNILSGLEGVEDVNIQIGDVGGVACHQRHAMYFGGRRQKAVDKIGAPVGEVIEAIKLYPVDAYVAEGFKMPDQSYQFPRNAAERKLAVDGGGEAKNFVQGIYKIAA